MTDKPKAIVVDGAVVRVYADADHIGDRGYLLDELFTPRHCTTPAQVRQWFKGTLAFRALGGAVFVDKVKK